MVSWNELFELFNEEAKKLLVINYGFHLRPVVNDSERYYGWKPSFKAGNSLDHEEENRGKAVTAELLTHAKSREDLAAVWLSASVETLLRNTAYRFLLLALRPKLEDMQYCLHERLQSLGCRVWEKHDKELLPLFLEPHFRRNSSISRIINFAVSNMIAVNNQYDVVISISTFEKEKFEQLVAEGNANDNAYDFLEYINRQSSLMLL